MTAESYRIKALLIKERESFFTDEDFQANVMKSNDGKPYFPRYLILRRPVLGKGDEDVDWQGFVKDLRKTITQSEKT